ncbi:MAG: hypothetical protein RUMPE_00921 [Eubacteriales bacterium SKADARSKE-1]|nr:hypothetical protein [Eubacteriales bacterium SKADARSKE-1]
MTNTDITKAFQDKLEDLVAEQKKENDYTFDDFSKNIGIPKSSLSKYLNDEAESGINNLVKIAKYFGVSTDYLLGLSNVKSPIAEVKSACKYTGLTENAIKVLETAKREKESYKKNKEYFKKYNDHHKFHWIDILNEFLEDLNYFPEIKNTFEDLANLDFSGDSFETENFILDKDNELYDKIYKNGTVLCGIDYKNFLRINLKDEFSDLISFILNKINLTEVEKSIGIGKLTENQELLISKFSICNSTEKTLEYHKDPQFCIEKEGTKKDGNNSEKG